MMVRVGIWMSCLVALAAGHSFLIQPTADWTDELRPECRVGKPTGPAFENLVYMQCHGPCGDEGVDQNGARFFSSSHGHTTMARGQRLYMKWTKNNHKSGFVRFTLVPKALRMDKAAHDKFAFRYACWEAGEISCESGSNCGTDQSNLRYQTEVEIPRVFPDGEYVLGWSWYGGSQYASNNNGQGGQEMSEFGDYWSCANVRIHGGISETGVWEKDSAVESDYTPIFVPGMNDRTETKCLSAVNRLGVCTREPCKIKDSNDQDTGNRYKAEMMVPAGFENGATPKPIQSKDVQSTMENKEVPESSTGDSKGESSLSAGNAESGNVGLVTETATEKGQGHVAGEGQSTITHFELFNTKSSKVIPFDFKGSIDITSFRSDLTVRAVVSDPSLVDSLSFSIGNQVLRTEHFVPYYIAGDVDGEVYPWEGNGLMPLNTEFTLKAVASFKDGSSSDLEANIELKSQ